MLSMAARNLLRMNMAPGVARGWKEMIVANAAKPCDLFACKGGFLHEKRNDNTATSSREG